MTTPENQELAAAKQNLQTALDNQQQAGQRLEQAKANLGSAQQDLAKAEAKSDTKPEDLEKIRLDVEACAEELKAAEQHVAGTAQGVATAEAELKDAEQKAEEAAAAAAAAATAGGHALEIWQVRGTSNFTAGPHPTSGKTFNNVVTVTHEADEWIRDNVAAGVLEKVGVAKSAKGAK